MQTIQTSLPPGRPVRDLSMGVLMGRVEWMSEAAASFFGVDASRAPGLPLAELGEVFADAFLRARERPTQVRTAAAELVIDWSIRVLPGDDRVIAIGIDVTPEVRERDALRLAVERLDTVLRNMTDLAWMKDRDSRFLYVNDALAELAGTTATEMVGRTDADYFPSGLVQSYLAGDEQVLAAGKELRTIDEIVTSAGEPRWIETIKRPVFDASGTVTAIAGVARDISRQHAHEAERHDLARQLAAKHEMLTETIQNVPGVVWEEWFDGSYRYVSNAVHDLLGYSPSEYMERFPSFLDVLHPDDVERVRARTEEMVAASTGGAHSFRMIHRDGTVLWCESHCSLIVENGRAVGLRGVSTEVTSRKAAEDLLRESEERFRELVGTAPVMLWTTDAVGNLTFASHQLLDFIGVDADVLLGDRWLKALHPDDRQRVIATLTDAIRNQSVLRYEARCRHADEQYRHIIVEGVPRFGAEGEFIGLVGNSIDLTEVRQLERRVEESRRLSSLGKLAATIAHEINNMLMGIQPFADMIARTSSPETIRNAAAQIKKSIDRGRRITHGILGHANTADPRLQPLEVAQWTREYLPELRAIAGDAVSIHTAVEEGLVILADGPQLQQVFTNLVANARDAMPGGGVIMIEARLGHGRREGMAHFIVSDTGCGMDHRVLEQIFDPLFTTKSSGTGLGLPLVREIIEKHGGAIGAESSINRGTAFDLVLPVALCAPEVAEPAASGAAMTHRRILLVEDDPAVSSGLAALLELEGMEVAIAERAGETLAAIDTFKPDAVLLDVGLPDAPGTEVFGWIRAAHPRLPLLFSTGHGREIELKSYLAQPSTGYLLKPYSIEELMVAMATI